MTQDEPDFRYWWTVEEWGRDKRTATIARIREKQRDEWRWFVFDAVGSKLLKEGTSTSQKGARAACRRFVRKLPRAA